MILIDFGDNIYRVINQIKILE